MNEGYNTSKRKYFYGVKTQLITTTDGIPEKRVFELNLVKKAKILNFNILALLVAGEIEISNHSINNLFELEAFIKTHSILLIAS
nr:hypothetical protein [Aquimarina latercula]